MKQQYLLSYLIIVFVTAVLPLSLSAQQPTPNNICRDVIGLADVVVMVDITASQSKAEIDQEKSALLSFLNFFGAPNVVQKPFVGVGTFHHDCTFANNTLNCVGDAARILPNSSLTDNYGAPGGAPDLYDDVDGITGPGFLGNGKGGTNIEEALKVAQAELTANGSPSRPDFIVIISDGDPNLPGFNMGSCNDCTCPVAEDAADNYANSIEPDTQVVTIHFRGSLINCPDESGEPAGLVYMRDRLASSPLLFHAGLNLASTFQLLAQDLVCDDQDSCTIDICNPQTTPVSCEFTPDATDSDNDNVPDCMDQCPNGDDSQIDESCMTGTGQCETTGQYICAPNGGIICDAVAGTASDEICDGLDNDCNGQIDDGINCTLDCAGVVGGSATLDRCDVCEGDGTSCLDCNETDNVENLFSLDGAALQQRKLVARALTRLKRKRPKSSKVTEFIAVTDAQSQQLYNDSWTKTWSQPSAVVSCTNTSFCFDLDITTDVADISSNSLSQKDLMKQILRKIRRATGRRRRIDRQFRKRMNDLVDLTESILSDLPTTSSVCT